MVTLKNDQLIVKINQFGAELSSVIDRQSDFEFIWQADDNYWGRHAPVLFPIVGRLKDDQYEYKGKKYEMTQHGFARDSEFTVESVHANSAVFSLTYDEDTIKTYPFKFQLLVEYLLHGSNLTVNYEIINLSKSEVMYYSVGGHPAFNMSQKEDITGEVTFKDVSMEILPERAYRQMPISEEGLTQLNRHRQVRGLEKQLTHESFKDDALIYEILNQSEIVLRDNSESVEIRIKPNRMDYLGVWSPYPKKAGFICLEPWTGFADSQNTTGKLNEKDGISFLDADEKMTHEYTINFLKETRLHSIKRWDN